MFFFSLSICKIAVWHLTPSNVVRSFSNPAQNEMISPWTTAISAHISDDVYLLLKRGLVDKCSKFHPANSKVQCFPTVEKLYLDLWIEFSICASIKTPYIGDGHPTMESLQWIHNIHSYYSLDNHPLLSGNKRSLDPSTCKKTSSKPYILNLPFSGLSDPSPTDAIVFFAPIPSRCL